MKMYLKSVLLLATLLFSGLMHARESNKVEYTFGIVPQQSAAKIARLWGPMLSHLGKESGLRLKLVTARDIPTFERRLADGTYDFAYMNPYHFTVYQSAPGYVALAKQKNKSIRGIVVVRKDSEMSTLEDLRGSTLAFPSPAAFAASILPRGGLSERGISFTPKYVSSHDSVYLAVARGFLPAGGGVLRTFNNSDPKVREQLRIFWTTPKYTPHAFASHPRVPESDRQKLLKVMLALDEAEAGKALLKAINFKGVEAAGNSDWDDVRSLQLTVLDD